VSIGDGVWDIETAATLGLPFIGIARGLRRDRLRAAGASVVFADYLDVDAFIQELDTAGVPRVGVGS
jgi:phosphoglycolate phosphatase-like HAD superfamily hydrolase